MAKYSDVFVSGVGLVTPLGAGRDRTWARLMAGESGIHPTPDGLQASVVDFSPNGARSRAGDFVLLAVEEALIQAGLKNKTLTDVGCAISLSKPLISTPLEPTLLMSSFFGWSMETLIRKKYKWEGPFGNMVSACSSGVTSLEQGAHWIESGQCSMAVVGAGESSLHPIYISGFQNLGVLSEGHGADSIRPFDQARNGFAMGEGAAILILESRRSIEERGQRPLARLTSARLRQNPGDSVRFEQNGSSVGRLIDQTVSKDKPIDYINAHGTATWVNDEWESLGIGNVIEQWAGDHWVSSTKAATGHLLGAAGAVEAGFCVLALSSGEIPPNLHLKNPVRSLRFVTESHHRQPIGTALSLSYGFGGQMGAVLFERCVA